MTTDDNPLADLDLEAWQPPAVPDGIADAVLRRMREPTAAAAREVVERPRRGSRVATAAIAAATVAIGGATAFWVTSRPDEPARVIDGRGDLIAARASHLELGKSSVDVDAGGELHWRRDQRRLVVTQTRGTATWRVDGADTIEIDPGAVGASVEASGASLRVEVQMQLSSSDARVVTASAVTAVAVALVTVIVYQGHVKVSSGGQTVNVGAGGAVKVKPGEPAREIGDVAASPAPVIAGGPEERDGVTLGVTGEGRASVTAGLSQPALTVPPTPQNIAPSELEAHRRKGERNILPDDFVKRAIRGAGDTRVISSFKMCVDVTGKVSEVRVLKSSGYPEYDHKIEREMRAWEYTPFEVDGKPVPICTATTFIYKQE